LKGIEICSMQFLYQLNLYQIRSIRGQLIFCFHLKTTACGIILSITWRSLWWTCSIAKNMWTMVSAFQNWRFRCCRQGTRKTAQKVRRRGIASIAGWKWFTKTTRRAIEQFSQQTVSNRLWEMGKIQKVGRWVLHKLNERQMERRKNTYEILLER